MLYFSSTLAMNIVNKLSYLLAATAAIPAEYISKVHGYQRSAVHTDIPFLMSELSANLCKTLDSRLVCVLFAQWPSTVYIVCKLYTIDSYIFKRSAITLGSGYGL